MREIEEVEAGMPADLQFRVDQLDWEYQSSLARRERSRHIAAGLRTFSQSLRRALARVLARVQANTGGPAISVPAAPLQHQ